MLTKIVIDTVTNQAYNYTVFYSVTVTIIEPVTDQTNNAQTKNNLSINPFPVNTSYSSIVNALRRAASTNKY